MSEYGQSNFDDQGITFGPNCEVHDEMKRMYQSSLKAMSAPEAPPGDKGDDESDHRFDRKPQQGGSDPRHPHKDPCGDNQHGGRNGGGGGGGHTPWINGRPPGPPDDRDKGDGDDKSEGGSHQSQHGNNHRTSPDRRRSRPRQPHRGYSVPAAVHPCYNTPGVMEAVEHHRGHMHEQIL